MKNEMEFSKTSREQFRGSVNKGRRIISKTHELVHWQEGKTVPNVNKLVLVNSGTLEWDQGRRTGWNGKGKLLHWQIRRSGVLVRGNRGSTKEKQETAKTLMAFCLTDRKKRTGLVRGKDDTENYCFKFKMLFFSDFSIKDFILLII